MSQYEPRLKTYERERILLEAIKNNENLHHNGLLKKIVPQFMAKATFEKTRDILLEKEIIFVSLKGNMKFYRMVENYEEKSFHKIERATNNSFHDLKLQIRRLDTDFPHKDIDEKLHLANTILRNLFHTDNGFTVLDSVKNPKKTLYRDEHLIIQQLIYQVFTIIRNDHDFELLFPTIMSNFVSLMPQLNFED